MSISVASCTIKENRLQLRRGLNRCPQLLCLCLPRTCFGADASSAKALRDASSLAEDTTIDCSLRTLRRVRAIRIRCQSRMAWQGKASSNHREHARVMSLCRWRQIFSPARQALVPSAKLFAVTFFSAAFPNGFLHCLIASVGYGFAQLPSFKTASIANECSTPRPS